MDCHAASRLAMTDIALFLFANLLKLTPMRASGDDAEKSVFNFAITPIKSSDKLPFSLIYFAEKPKEE